jgi:hypothetical protein
LHTLETLIIVMLMTIRKQALKLLLCCHCTIFRAKRAFSGEVNGWRTGRPSGGIKSKFWCGILSRLATVTGELGYSKKTWEATVSRLKSNHGAIRGSHKVLFSILWGLLDHIPISAGPWSLKVPISNNLVFSLGLTVNISLDHLSLIYLRR